MLVAIAESFFSDGHGLDDLVIALTSDGVDFGVAAFRGDGDGDVPEEDADVSEDSVVSGYTGVMGEALVAGEVVEVVCTHIRVVCEVKK